MVNKKENPFGLGGFQELGAGLGGDVDLVMVGGNLFKKEAGSPIAPAPKQAKKPAPKKKRRKTKNTLSISRIRATQIKRSDTAYPKGAVYQDVIIPSTDYDKPVSKRVFNQRVKEVQIFFSNLFGGFTQVGTVGGWVSDGKVIKETGAKVVSFSSKGTWTKANQRKVVTFLRRKCKEWKQEAIAYRVEDDIFFLKPL